MRKFAKRAIRGCDSFSHPVQLLFNGNKSHSTTLGGLMSICVKLICFIWFIGKLTNGKDDFIVTSNTVMREQNYAVQLK